MTAQISLIITVLNEAQSISEWLESLSAQTRLPDELIVCDGGSADRTADVIRGWAENNRALPVTVLDRPGANISEGRNIAISAANGPWIAVTDAGTRLESDWLEQLAANLDGADVVSGFFYPAGAGVFEKILATMVTFRLAEIDPVQFLPSSRSLLIRKEWWERVGGYPEWLDYCEDLVFDVALRNEGARFRFAPAALVSWSARPTLRSYAKQYYRYGRGDGKAGLFAGRHFLRYVSWLAGVGILVFAPLGRPGSLAAVGAGFAVYNWRYYRRIMASDSLGPGLKLLGLVLVPFLSFVGDAAKMLGYPVGVAWRRRRGRRVRVFE